MKPAALMLKPESLLFLLCLTLLPAAALVASENGPPLTDISKILLSDTIRQRTWYFSRPGGNIAAGEVASLPYSPTVSPGIFRQLGPKEVQQDWFLFFRVENSSDSVINCYFFTGKFPEKMVVYTRDEASGITRELPAAMPGTEDSLGYRRLSLAPRSRADYFVLAHFIKASTNNMEPRLIRSYYQPAFSRTYAVSTTGVTMYTYIIVGILLMMIIYSMAVFVLNSTREYFYYSCYAFFMGLLFFLKSYYFNRIVSFNFFFESFLDFVIQGTGTFFYLVFMRKFIEAKSRFPFLHRLLVLSQVITILGMVLFSLFYFFSDNYYLQDLTENFTKILWTPVTILFAVYSFRRSNRLLNYLSVGQLFLLVSGIASLTLIHNPSIMGVKLPSILTDSLFYYEVGITIELIFFLMALAFKNRRDLVDRTRERERLKLENERKEFEKHLAIVEAKQEERNRISADMHDDLGSGVTAIRLMSEIVKTKMKGAALPEIEKISNSANELLSKMNTIIWTMSSVNDKLDNVVAYTRSYATEFFENTGIECHFEQPEQVPAAEISGEKRRNIFLCIKESLNNVVKHSGATDVWISFALSTGKLEIRIRDNGVGINLEKLRQFGNGLVNMRKRIESIDGSFTIARNNGTITVFSIPLN